MDESLEFFEKTIGRPATSAEQTGNVSLDVILQLMDGKIAAAAPPATESAPAKPAAPKAPEAAAS